MAKYVYPAVFTAEEDGYFSVRFPDLESCYTSGKGVEETLEMAEDVLCLVLYRMEEEKKEIPAPSQIQKVPAAENEFVSLVAADTLEYRKTCDNRAVKKTLTIPAWLNTMAERQHINFSAVLQAALKNTLQVE